MLQFANSLTGYIFTYFDRRFDLKTVLLSSKDFRMGQIYSKTAKWQSYVNEVVGEETKRKNSFQLSWEFQRVCFPQK